ncbi:MAG: TonB-dependent receptor [Candidatus Marinimicrobia bacterium]|nr:TonB-dependent receptor [Candidatus Neomarinimicrobiota bacterium]
MRINKRIFSSLLILTSFIFSTLLGQGVTTAELSGSVSDGEGAGLEGANVVATFEPSGITYGTTSRTGGVFNIPNMRVGGPYTVTISYIGYKTESESNVHLRLGTSVRLNFTLQLEAIEMVGVEVVGEQDDVMNSSRTGAATYIGSDLIAAMPSIKRSTRDLTRLDPRSDGNFSFGGRNWLYNNISLDGSYFNNAFGLDDPAPGGQTNAEPVSYDAIEQVQVSIAPFDVREGGFTGAGINTVTKSGTNELHVSLYSYARNESFVGNSVGDAEVFESPSLEFSQSGVSISGPIIPNKLFFFVNLENEHRNDPGTNYYADKSSRVESSVMQAISDRMKDVYGYDTGPWENYTHNTDNVKILAKLDWNINDQHNLTLRYNKLEASRELPPHGFVLSYNNTGRGPNASSLPFKNSGYRINNNLSSYALELNSMFSDRIANRFFVSKNVFRDYREPFSVDFPTIEIGEDGVTYTTVGHEPFSIHNILDQDVLQVTNNLTYYMGKHAITAGFNYESFKFFNSFNIFRHGLFMVTGDLDLLFPGAGYLDYLGATTFSSIENFFTRTDPTDSTNFYDFNSVVDWGAGPNGEYKGEQIDVSQISFYVQDEFAVNKNLQVTAGIRVDIPKYDTTPVENPFSTGLTLLDENDDPETVDQAKLAGDDPLFSPRIGFNWGNDDRSLQVRGGIGIFTGRLPFVWIGNVISNPGQNPNIIGDGSNGQTTDDGEGREVYEGTKSTLQQSFDLNAMVDDFKWPQVRTINLAVDKQLPGNMLATLELVQSTDINAIYMRNADLVGSERTLADGRPYFGGAGANELNYDPFNEGNGVYVIDNIDEGSSLTLTAQLRGRLGNGLNWSAAYTFLDAKNNLQSTEIASVLFQSQPVQGDPNKPSLSPSQFGLKQRIIASATYRHQWSKSMATSFGMVFEMGEGNRYIYSGGNRYSHVYSGDVNGDGFGGNDLIYIPESESDIHLTNSSDWTALDAFIEQDPYLSENRGKIAERNGLLNPWFSNIDLRINNEFAVAGRKIEVSLDIMNLANLLNSSWGVRQIANVSATSPLTLDSWTEDGEPVFSFNGATETFSDDFSEFSRWRMQLGLKISF